MVAVDSGENFHFFVEPDGKSRWRVAITRQQWHALLDDVHPVITVPDAYFVKQVSFSSREWARLGVGRDQYKLELKDREGKILTATRDLTRLFSIK
jgi:hypothetical protein